MVVSAAAAAADDDDDDSVTLQLSESTVTSL